MSFFSSVLNVASTLIKNPVESFKQGAAAITPLVANPLTTIKEGYGAAKEKTYSSTLYTNVKNILTTGAVATAAITVGGAIAGTSSALASSIGAGTKAIALAPFSSVGAFGKTIVGGAAAITADQVLSKSDRANQALLNAPSNLSNYGSNIGNFIDNPSISNAVSIAKENPLLTAGTLGAAGILGYSSLGTAASLLNTKAINNLSDAEKETKVIIENAKETVQAAPTSQQPINIYTNPPINAEAPTTNNPVVAPSVPKKSTKKRKSTKKKKTIKTKKTSKKKKKRAKK